MLKGVIGKCQGQPYNIVFDILDTTVIMVMPLLTQASEVWDNKAYNDIENNVQKKKCSQSLG